MKRNFKCFWFVLAVFIISSAGGPCFGREDVGIDSDVLQSYQLAGRMYDKGKQEFAAEDMAAAEKTLKQCVEIFPRHSEAHYTLSRIFYKTGNFVRALVHIKKAKADAGFMVKVLTAAQDTYFDRLSGEKEKLRIKLSDAAEQVVVDRIKRNIAVIDNWLKQPRPQVDQLTAAYNYWHGNILLKLQKFTGARDQYLEAVRLSTENGDAYLGLATVSFLLRRHETALQHLDRAEALLGRKIPDLRKAIRLDLSSGGDLFALLTQLSNNSRQSGDPSREIQTFISLYTKFYNRPRLLNRDVLLLLHINYQSFNVLVDFIEKIPIQKPETVIKLIGWAKVLAGAPKKNKVLTTSLFQSVLEVIAQTARYAPGAYDYDALIVKLTEIPLERGQLYWHIFNFFETELGISAVRKDLMDVVLGGMEERVIVLNNVRYRFMVRDKFRADIETIMESQDTCSFKNLLQINRTLGMLSRNEAGASSLDFGNRAVQLLGTLPIAQISSEAPKDIRVQVMPYSRESLDKTVGYLVNHLGKGDFGAKFKSLVHKIEREFLLPQLNHYMLTLAYALNAKSPKLRIFLNPNITRLHDFSEKKDRTPWNYCGTPPPFDFLSEFRLSGGLSRLNVSLAAKWQDYLFSRTYIHNSPHVQSLLINVLDTYPVPVLPNIEQTVTYNALMVDFGLKLIRNAETNPSLRLEVIDELAAVTSGYHYRKAVDFLSGMGSKHNLFFTEIKQLGEAFFKKGKYPDLCGCGELSRERDYLPVGIYYRTLGSLKSQPVKLFPQEVSHVFNAGWSSGEMVDEFLVKLSWLLHKKKIPPSLMGHIIYSYLVKTVPRLLSQNHTNDHFASYFVFTVFNNAHVSKILKDMQKQGYLKLK